MYSQAYILLSMPLGNINVYFCFLLAPKFDFFMSFIWAGFHKFGKSKSVSRRVSGLLFKRDARQNFQHNFIFLLNCYELEEAFGIFAPIF